jgi:hypothetical protein
MLSLVTMTKSFVSFLSEKERKREEGEMGKEGERERECSIQV